MTSLEYEVTNFGIIYAENFHGISTTFTDWSHAVYGTGHTWNEALLDAIERVAESLNNSSYSDDVIEMACDSLASEFIDGDKNDLFAVGPDNADLPDDWPSWHVGIHFSVVVKCAEEVPF